MGLGGLGGNTVAFGIKAVADLRGVDQTAKALSGLNAKGATAGTGISHGMDAAGRSLDTARAKAEALHGSLARISTGGLLIGGGIAAGLGLAVRTFAGFEHEMNAVRSVTGATGEEFKKLNNLALQIGKDTTFSASEAAGAIEELAKAGISTENILKGAAAGATSLAAAAGVAIPEAALFIASALNEFGLAGDQAIHVADIFANVSNKSAADAVDFGNALNYVGTQAHTLNIPLEDVAAAIAAMADQGLKGSHAGTALGQAFASLVAPSTEAARTQRALGISVKDSAGNFVGLPSILNQVEKATAGMGNAQKSAALNTLFGIEGARAINALLNTQTDEAKAAGRSWDDYSKAVREQGTAAAQAAIRNKGLSGSIEQLRGSIETAQIALGSKLAPAIELAAAGIKKLADGFAALPGSVQSVVAFGLAGTAALALLAAAGARIISIGVGTAATWGRVAGSFAGAGAAADEAAVGMAAAGISAEASAAGVTALAAAEGEVAVSSTAATVGTRALGASFLSFATNPVVLALAAISAATLLVIQRHRAHQQAVHDLQAAYGSLNDTLNQFKLAGADAGQISGLAALTDKLKSGGDQINATAEAIKSQIRDIQDELRNVDAGSDAFGQLSGQLDDLKSKLASIGDGTATFTTASELINKALTTQGADVPRLLGIFNELTDAYLRGQSSSNGYLAALQDVNNTIGDYALASADATAATTDQTDALAAQVDEQIASKKAQDDLSRAVKDTLNQQFLASAASQGLLLPFTRGAEDAQKATEDFNKTLDGITAGAINAAKGIGDISSELPGVQAGFGKVGDSITDVFRKMDDIGIVNFSPAVRQALDFVSALAKVEANIAGVEAAITNNQQDLAMWQARISLVTDTFGANSQQINDWISQLENGTITQEQFNAAIAGLSSSGGFPKLDALLASGKISQKEYAAAVEAGTHLLQRSAGALGDEEAEIVRNIIALDKYVKQHDDADGAVKNLTESQRGFVAAMADSKTQTFLQTLQLLAYLASIGQIPPEAVTKFIVDSSAADPEIAAVAQDLGLIAGPHTGTVTMDTAPALESLKDVKGVVVHISDDGATITVKARTEDAAQKFLELNKGAIADLDGRELIVKVKGDDGEYVVVRDAVIGDKIPDKVVNVTANLDSFLAGGDGSSPDLGHIASAVQSPTVIQPPPVVFTAVDEVTPVLTGVNNELSVFATDATILGQTAGQGFVNAAAAGISDGISNIGAAANGVLGALNSVGVATTNLGFNDGYSFGVGLANGITATTGAVFNAAFNLGIAAHLGTQAGMQAHSPSRLAKQDGENWVASFVASLDAGKGAVRRSASDLSKLMQTSIVSPATSPALRGLLTVDQRPARILSDSINAQRGGNATSNTTHFQVTNHFNGITDTGEIINEVNTSVFRAFDRHGSTGLFGR